jgi:hypothetical protein
MSGAEHIGRIQRMVDEHWEANERRRLLAQFVDSHESRKVAREEQERLSAQLRHMTNYTQTLWDRVIYGLKLNGLVLNMATRKVELQENVPVGSPVGTDCRSRPPLRSGGVRVILERGDGECIDIGELPDFANALKVARFLVKLQDADNQTGTYTLDVSGEAVWTPSRLQFNVSQGAGNEV